MPIRLLLFSTVVLVVAALMGAPAAFGAAVMGAPAAFGAAVMGAPVTFGDAGTVNVQVRVEGKTRTIFGETEPTLTPVIGAIAAEGEGEGEEEVMVSAPTALGALEAASLAGEFDYNLKLFSFGSFVDRIARFSSKGATGWLFKVNGKAPDVGASDVVLKDGDVVLWYWAKLDSTTFAGPDTLNLIRKRGCLVAQVVNANGKATRVRNVVFRLDEVRRIRSKSGRICTGNYKKARAVKRSRGVSQYHIRSQVLTRR